MEGRSGEVGRQKKQATREGSRQRKRWNRGRMEITSRRKKMREGRGGEEGREEGGRGRGNRKKAERRLIWTERHYLVKIKYLWLQALYLYLFKTKLCATNSIILRYLKKNIDLRRWWGSKIGRFIDRSFGVDTFIQTYTVNTAGRRLLKYMVMIHEVLNEGNIISYFFKKTIRAILNSHTFARGNTQD